MSTKLAFVINTAIFISTPHRGSSLATSLPGLIGARLSACPRIIEELAKSFVTENIDLLKPEFAAFVANKVNSISTLRPDSPVTGMLANFPIDRHVTFHTISGIKRNPLGKINEPPTDGIVPLSSAVLPGADCEVGVYSGHGAHTTDEAIQVVQSLLKLHIGVLTEAEVAETIKGMGLPFSRYNGMNLTPPASPALKIQLLP